MVSSLCTLAGSYVLTAECFRAYGGQQSLEAVTSVCLVLRACATCSEIEKGVREPEALGGKQGLDITVWCPLQVREPERGWETGG